MTAGKSKATQSNLGNRLFSVYVCIHINALHLYILLSLMAGCFCLALCLLWLPFLPIYLRDGGRGFLCLPFVCLFSLDFLPVFLAGFGCLLLWRAIFSYLECAQLIVWLGLAAYIPLYALPYDDNQSAQG